MVGLLRMTHTSVAAGSSEAQKCDHWEVGGKPVRHQVSNTIFQEPSTSPHALPPKLQTIKDIVRCADLRAGARALLTKTGTKLDPNL